MGQCRDGMSACSILHGLYVAVNDGAGLVSRLDLARVVDARARVDAERVARGLVAALLVVVVADGTTGAVVR